MRPNPLGSKRRNKPTLVERKPSWKGRAKKSSDIWEAAKRPNHSITKSEVSSPLAEIRFLSDLAHDDVRIPLTSPS